MMLFEAMSGLKVNLRKSELIPIGEVPNIQFCPISSVVALGLCLILTWVLL